MAVLSAFKHFEALPVAARSLPGATLPVPFENPIAPDRHGALCAGRRARLIRSPAGLRLSTGHDHEPFCSVLVSTHTPCTSTSSAISGSLTSSWTNYAPGCATPHRCVFLWLAIDPCTKIFPVLQLGPRTQHMAHMVLHSLRQILAAFLPPALYQ